MYQTTTSFQKASDMSDGICLASLQEEKSNISKKIRGKGGKQSELLEMNPPVTVDIIRSMRFEDINARNEYGFTALQMAAIGNRVDVIKSLLEFTGIEINKTSSFKTNRNTAFFMRLNMAVWKLWKLY